MKYMSAWIILLLAGAGCYQRQDPVMQAAQDLQDMAYGFAAQEEEQIRRLNALRLGMSDEEVLDAVGSPSARQSTGASPAESREVWTYRKGLRPQATLTFTDQRLTEIKIE